MELFAAGCNAWNQLSFKDPDPDLPPSSSTHPPEEDEPHDFFSFTKILQGRKIEKPIGRLSYTIARRDGTLLVSGFGLPDHSPPSLEFLSTCVETATGETLALDSASGGGLRSYPSFTSWRTGHPAARPRPCDVPVTQMAAFDTGFAVLHEDGTVSTFGDPRFESSLGRDVSSEQPAHIPSPVPDLTSLNDPIAHITAGGLSVAALTRSGAVYVWATPSAGTHRRPQPFPSNRVGGVPNYVPVDGDKDVRDVALGDAHAIALTADGCVYVIGDNGNGQLGLAGTMAGGQGQGYGLGEGQGQEQGQGESESVSVVKRVEEWTRVPFEVPPGSEVVGVAAGLKASFIITSRKTGASPAS